MITSITNVTASRLRATSNQNKSSFKGKVPPELYPTGRFLLVPTPKSFFRKAKDFFLGLVGIKPTQSQIIARQLGDFAKVLESQRGKDFSVKKPLHSYKADSPYGYDEKQPIKRFERKPLEPEKKPRVKDKDGLSSEYSAERMPYRLEAQRRQDELDQRNISEQQSHLQNYLLLDNMRNAALIDDARPSHIDLPAQDHASFHHSFDIPDKQPDYEAPSIDTSWGGNDSTSIDTTSFGD